MQTLAKTVSVALVAGQPNTVYLAGTYLRCLSGDALNIELGTRESEFSGAIPISTGKSIAIAMGFETVRLTSPTSQTVTFLAVVGDYRDDTLIFDESLSLSTKPAGLTTETKSPVTALAGVTTLIAAANASRRYLALFNEGTEAVYIRETSATAKSPLVLAPGAFLPVPLTSAVYAYNPSVTDVSLLVGEFT